MTEERETPDHGEVGNDVSSTDEATTVERSDARRRATSDDFLMPGPTPESNEGLFRWGLSWLIFSIVLIVLMAAISFVCLTLATWTGLA